MTVQTYYHDKGFSKSTGAFGAFGAFLPILPFLPGRKTALRNSFPGPASTQLRLGPTPMQSLE
jgi:hypothetical protein